MANQSEKRQAGTDFFLGEVVSFPRVQPAGGIRDVERIDLFAIYEIGAQIRPMSEMAERGATKSDLFAPLLNAIDAFKTLLAEAAPTHIDLCRGDAVAARDALERLEKQLFRDQEGRFVFPSDAEERVEHWRMYEIKTTLQRFEAVFRAEMQKAGTYQVPKRGVYDVGDLVDRADQAFPSALRPKIGEQAFREYRAAGRCYAFGLYTAAGYHACRAMEAVLREYYRAFSGEEDTGTETWGALLALLEKCEAGGSPKDKTLDRIRHVKEYHRNPLSHLRSELDETDADMLLSGVKVAIGAMTQELIEKEASPAQLVLLPSVVNE